MSISKDGDPTRDFNRFPGFSACWQIIHKLSCALGSHISISVPFWGHFLLWCFLPWMREHAFPSWKPGGSTQDTRFSQLGCLFFPLLPLALPHFSELQQEAVQQQKLRLSFFGQYLVHQECHQKQINISCTSEKNPSLLKARFTPGSWTGNTMTLLLP